MPIEVKCPNGHSLRVQRRFAGQTIHCPACQSQLVVPKQTKISEQDVLEFLGPPPRYSSPAHAEAPRHPLAPADESKPDILRMPSLLRQMKVCPKCKAEVRACYDLCPHCRTYFSDLDEIRRRIASA